MWLAQFQKSRGQLRDVGYTVKNVCSWVRGPKYATTGCRISTFAQISFRFKSLVLPILHIMPPAAKRTSRLQAFHAATTWPTFVIGASGSPAMVATNQLRKKYWSNTAAQDWYHFSLGFRSCGTPLNLSLRYKKCFPLVLTTFGWGCSNLAIRSQRHTPLPGSAF